MAVKLFSKLDYTVTVPYGKSNIMIPPFARELFVANEKELGTLPKGIKSIKVADNKKEIK